MSRETFLSRVRKAVADGNIAGVATEISPRGNVGYQGGGTDLIKGFVDALNAAGGQTHVVADVAAASARVMDLVESKSAKQVLLGRGEFLDALALPQRLDQRGVQVQVVDLLERTSARDQFFQADLGISGVAYAVAETGTLVMAASPADPRSLSLLPPLHIAVVAQAQLVPDLFDLFARVEPDKTSLPSCLSFITGPSKTGDIELKLVTGVHGPGELHVIVIANSFAVGPVS